MTREQAIAKIKELALVFYKTLGNHGITTDSTEMVRYMQIAYGLGATMAEMEDYLAEAQKEAGMCDAV